jgi:hypothetical protein
MDALKLTVDIAQCVGVLAAIIFGVQAFRQNHRTSIASAASQLYTQAEALFTLRMQSQALLAHLKEDYQKLRAADPKAHDQCVCLMVMAFNLYEQAYYYCKRYGIFAEYEWTAWAAEMKVNWLDYDFTRGFWEVNRNCYSTGFRGEMNSRIPSKS